VLTLRLLLLLLAEGFAQGLGWFAAVLACVLVLKFSGFFK